ncbi:MAG: hypothetical protein M3Y82_08625 [Verrucomicrobiota bacterium]|nr:hypothetical protein [Verrucomicrobiota bacterium]
MKKLLGILAILFLVTFLAPSVWAKAYPFANPGVITINDSTSPPTKASPYPSTISVSGIPSNEKIDKITVTLRSLYHSKPSDIDILLVGPGGENIILFSDAGGTTTISEVTLTLDDDATNGLPLNGPIVPGTFQPSNYGVAMDTFPSPAPAPSSAANLSVFKGTDPNGLWRLFVVDDAAGGSGSIVGGWSMTIRTATTFSNPGFIRIRDASSATPYPSFLQVTGLVGKVIKMTATLNDFAHTHPDDVDIMLVTPSGNRNLLLMSDAGGSMDVTNKTFTFDDSAAAQMSNLGPLTSGTFLPSNFGSGADPFPPFAPVPSSATKLSHFNGIDPNGIWDLYVVDDLSGGDGVILNGWSLSIVTEPPPPVIINLRRDSGTSFAFGWLSVVGVVYQLQLTSDLSRPDWRPTGGNLVGNGSIIPASIGIPPNVVSEFYRVVAF